MHIAPRETREALVGHLETAARPRRLTTLVGRSALLATIATLALISVACAGMFAPPGGIADSNAGANPGGTSSGVSTAGPESDNKRPDQIDAARKFTEEGRHLDALREIQRALLLAPENTEAIALKAQIREKIATSDTLIVVGEPFGGVKPQSLSQLTQYDADAKDMGIKPGYELVIPLPETIAISRITFRADTAWGDLVSVEARNGDGEWITAWTGAAQKLEATNGSELTMPARPVADSLRFTVKSPSIPSGRVSSVRIFGRILQQPPAGLLRLANAMVDPNSADKGGAAILLRGQGPYKVARFDLATNTEKELGRVDEVRDVVWLGAHGAEGDVFATTANGLVKVNPGGNEIIDKRMIGSASVRGESGESTERTGIARLASLVGNPASQTLYIGFDTAIWSMKAGEKPRRFGTVSLPPGREHHTIQQLVVAGSRLLVLTEGTCAGKPCGQWWPMSLDGAPLGETPQPDARLGRALLDVARATGAGAQLSFSSDFEVQYTGSGEAPKGLLRAPFLHSTPIEKKYGACESKARAALWLPNNSAALTLADACGKLGGSQAFVVKPDTGAAFQLFPGELPPLRGLGKLHFDAARGWWFADGYYGNVDGTLWRAPEGTFAAWAN